MERLIMKKNAQIRFIDGLQDHSGDNNSLGSWYDCESCENHIIHYVEFYGIERIEFLINSYESGLLKVFSGIHTEKLLWLGNSEDDIFNIRNSQLNPFGRFLRLMGYHKGERGSAIIKA